MTTVPQNQEGPLVYPPIVHPKAPTITTEIVNKKPPSEGAGPSAAQPITATMAGPLAPISRKGQGK